MLTGFFVGQNYFSFCNFVVSSASNTKNHIRNKNVDVIVANTIIHMADIIPTALRTSLGYIRRMN